MKTLIFILTLFPALLFAQSDSVSHFKIAADRTFHSGIEIFPSFNGDLNTYIQKNFEYPQKARDMGISGIVYVSFDVDTAGKISNIRISKSVNPILDSAAINFVSKMPKWKPGMNNGIPVFFTTYIMPVMFKLQDK